MYECNPVGNVHIPQVSPVYRFAPSQWETSFQSNAVSHWLGANLESALLLSLSAPKPNNYLLPAEDQ